MAQKTVWQNRIVGHADVDPQTLTANPLNFRRHPKAQADATTGSLNELGWVQDVLVNKTTGCMIDGHLRVELALKHGAATVPVKYVELSEAEERLALATLDPLTYMAETDAAALEALLGEVGAEDAALGEMLEQMALENDLARVQSVSGESIVLGELSKGAGAVKVVLPVAGAGLLERALLATGLQNRADAIALICTHYLGGDDGAEGQ
jgi:hypothetical protein